MRTDVLTACIREAFLRAFSRILPLAMDSWSATPVSPCPICGGAAHIFGAAARTLRAPARTAVDSNYAWCTGCGAVFLDPMPAPAILAREYNADGPDTSRDRPSEANSEPL